MKPEIITTSQRKLIGHKMTTSLSEYSATPKMWKNFMMRRNEITNQLNSGYYSVQIYDPTLKMQDFTPNTIFEKWAAVEVDSFDDVPKDMHSHILSGGKYAIFIHKGIAANFKETFDYIYMVWLAQSGYELDTREHFEIMGDKYFGPENPDSEEEVWIPIK